MVCEMLMRIDIISDVDENMSDEMLFKIRDILKNTSDYQHDNITAYECDNNIAIDIYIDDFRDHARSRQALLEVMKYIVDTTT